MCFPFITQIVADHFPAFFTPCRSVTTTTKTNDISSAFMLLKKL